MAVGRVLRNRTAGVFLAAVVVSGFGSSAMRLAAGIWAKSLTGSDALAALALFAVWLPVLFGPLLGAVADRLPRKPLLVGTNVVLAALMAMLAVVGGEGRVPLLFAVLVLYGCLSVLMDSAESAVVAGAVPAELLGDFNGLRMMANESMKLVAPLTGAGLYARFGGGAVALLDAVSFALAAGLYALLRVRRTAGPARLGPRGRAAGLRQLRGSPVLRPLVLAASATMLCAGLNGATLYAVVDDVLGHSPAYAGVLSVAQGLGSVAVGLCAGALMRRLPERVFAAAGIAVFGVAVGLRAVPSDAMALAACALIGVGLPCVLIAALTAVQRETPDAVLGRTAATADTLIMSPNAVALGIGAGLVARVDVTVLLPLVGAGAVLTAGLLLTAGRRERVAPGGPVAPASAEA
ncbi:MFS transporter [Streptomyces sp. NPDC008163]|uniref:MFS transporter n=1 Tax=Streptomyces sp. NPDC008163 TaxID=3364818 RepID=UPI0036ED5028